MIETTPTHSIREPGEELYFMKLKLLLFLTQVSILLSLLLFFLQKIIVSVFFIQATFFFVYLIYSARNQFCIASSVSRDDTEHAFLKITLLLHMCLSVFVVFNTGYILFELFFSGTYYQDVYWVFLSGTLRTDIFLFIHLFTVAFQVLLNYHYLLAAVNDQQNISVPSASSILKRFILKHTSSIPADRNICIICLDQLHYIDEVQQPYSSCEIQKTKSLNTKHCPVAAAAVTDTDTSHKGIHSNDPHLFNPAQLAQTQRSNGGKDQPILPVSTHCSSITQSNIIDLSVLATEIPQKKIFSGEINKESFEKHGKGSQSNFFDVIQLKPMNHFTDRPMHFLETSSNSPAINCNSSDENGIDSKNILKIIEDQNIPTSQTDRQILEIYPEKIDLNRKFLSSQAPNVIIGLNCKHFFHFDCMEAWITTSENITCPTCRRNLND